MFNILEQYKFALLGAVAGGFLVKKNRALGGAGGAAVGLFVDNMLVKQNETSSAAFQIARTRTTPDHLTADEAEAEILQEQLDAMSQIQW